MEEQKTPEERVNTKRRKKEQSAFVVHTKFIVDSIQRVANTEKLGEIPDIRFSIPTEIFLIGIEETKTYTVIAALSLPLLYLAKAILYVVEGTNLSNTVVIGIYIGIVLAVSILAYMREAFIFKFAKEYIIGKYSKGLWEVYLKAHLYGFAGLTGAIGIVVAFVYWGIMKAFRLHPEELNKIITELYPSLHNEEQRIRLYELGISISKYVIKPVPVFLELIAIYILTMIIMSLLTYFYPKSQIKLEDKTDNIIQDIMPENLKKPE